MPSAPADQRSEAGRSLWWVAGLVLCLGVATAVYLALGDTEDAALPADDPDRAVVARADAATTLLADLSRAVTRGPAGELRQLAAPGDAAAMRELLTLRHNVRRVGITDLSLRYVDENGGQVTTVRPRLADRAWVGDVQVSWRIRGFEETDSRMEVTMTFAESPDGAVFVSAREDYGAPAPLWLLDRLSVQRDRESLVMVASGPVGQYDDLAVQAVTDVRKVLPSWDGSLVVQVPDSERQLDRVLGSEDGTYGAIAAVTSPVDGSLEPGAPVHIFVNPPVFGPLGEQGAQIVMSHEATHVATEAATATMPTWLIEGFADYVALAHVDLPVEVTASQIIAQAKSDGVPKRLPGRAEFESQNVALGASYEAAWLACRLLAETYGEDRLLRFYERSDRDQSTDAAFRAVLGTSQPEFTRSWRDYLTSLAG